MSRDLTLDHRTEAGAEVVTAAGEIDVYTAAELREVLVPISNTSQAVVLDLEQVTFLDSTGLGVIIGALKRARAHDGSLVLVCTQERILAIFRLTGLTKVLPAYATTAAAIAAIRNGGGS